MPHHPYPNPVRARRQITLRSSPSTAATPAELPAEEPAPTASQPRMDRRSWYMPRKSAQALADAVDDLHHDVRCAKHLVLAELVTVALEHLPEVAVRLRAVENQGARPPAVPEAPVPQQRRIPFGSYIDPELHKELKVTCAGEGTEIRDALDQALRLWLFSRPAAGPSSS